MRILVEHLGDPEVEDLEHLAARRAVQEDVGGLDVAVDDARSVRLRQRSAQRGEDLRAAQGCHGPRAPDLLVQAVALQQLHHQEGGSAVGDAEVGDGDRVGMLDAAGGDAFALEADQSLRAAAGGGLEHLDRHVVLQLEVAGAVDGPEGAGADERLQSVLACQHAARLGFRVREHGRQRLAAARGRAPRAELRLDAREHHREVERLDDVVVGARLQRPDHVLAVAAGGGHDDRKLRRAVGLAEPAQHFHAGQARHLDVEQEEVHSLAAHHLQRGRSVGGGEDAVALPLQAAAEHVPVHLVVVDDEQRGAVDAQRGLGGHASSGRAPCATSYTP